MSKNNLIILFALATTLDEVYGIDIAEITPIEKRDQLIQLVATDFPEFMDKDYDEKEDFLQAYQDFLSQLV